ncbi:MAG: iron-containing alcohol dehydrogenase [Candidatus Omnitrophota bacterium]
MTDFPKKLLLPRATLFGSGCALKIGSEASDFGRRGVIVHGRSLVKNSDLRRISAAFPKSADVSCVCRAGGEPTLDEVSAVIRRARRARAGWIAGIGGGSVMDLAKAAAGLFNAENPPSFYQQGGRLEKAGIPFIAVPTTAGTGAEATPNAVIINSRTKEKLSIRDGSFLARKVMLDPDLLKSMPPDVMKYSAIDAYVQAYESYTSRNSTWFSDSLAIKAIALIDRNIFAAFRSMRAGNLSELLLGSYLAGVALASSRLGVIHGIAHPLGALYNVPHGLVCSACFMPSITINRKAMGPKYDSISGAIGADFVKRVKGLLKALSIKSPFSGRRIMGKGDIIRATLESGSTASNPKDITRKDVEYILREIFG